jgi:hypothetical protein
VTYLVVCKGGEESVLSFIFFFFLFLFFVVKNVSLCYSVIVFGFGFIECDGGVEV